MKAVARHNRPVAFTYAEECIFAVGTGLITYTAGSSDRGFRSRTPHNQLRHHNVSVQSMVIAFGAEQSPYEQYEGLDVSHIGL